MKLLFLFGNSAVGKMTVGQELAKITEMRLFHNHMTIEPVIEIFGRYDSKITARLRDVIFEEFAKSGNYGIIFTFMWAFDQPSDWDYISQISDIFAKNGADKDSDIYFAELVASQEIRLQRNATENRLKNKASKRDVEHSNRFLLHHDEKYRCESHDGEITFENYIKIDNSHLPPEAAAQIIKERFSL
ncbi:MAG: shikimate kinase [Christensenellales bacterium]|jgi:hypothetical protein